MASTDANSRLKRHAETGNIAGMEEAVADGAEVNNLDSGYTPLVWAVVEQKAESVRWLLAHGALPDLVAPDKVWTPLMSAASAGNAEITRILMEAGASPTIANKDGKSPILLAREKGHAALALTMSITPDEVVYSDTIYDRVVQEVYSFKRKERFTFVRKGEFGDVEAVTRERFADIADKSALRKAFDEHKKRGGKLDESDVFPDTLQKNRAQKGLSLQS
jgi:ankyrin repeat protein